jgi:hypothetical protein
MHMSEGLAMFLCTIMYVVFAVMLVLLMMCCICGLYTNMLRCPYDVLYYYLYWYVDLGDVCSQRTDCKGVDL